MTPTLLRTVDGVDLVAHVVLPTHGTARASVVVVHGFGASGTEEKVRAVVDALGDAGYAVVTYDARGHGESSGETTLGHLEAHDVAAAVDIARDLAPRVVLVGTSMGGIAVLRHAATTDDLAGVVTVACPAEWKLPRNARGLLSAVVTQTGFGRSLARSRLGVRIAPSLERGAPPAELARAIRVPIGVIHGRADPFITTSAAELIARNAAGPSRLEVVDGLAHAFDPAERAIPAILRATHWVLDPDA